MKIYKKWLKEQVIEAKNRAGIISIPIREFDIDDLIWLADIARENEIGITIWRERSNYSQDVLVELQRYKNRYEDTSKPQITYRI